MTEHRGTSFYNSCVKVPVDPCSRQPTPSYERIGSRNNKKYRDIYNRRKINFAKDEEYVSESEISSPRGIVDNFLEFLESIPDYGQVHHLSNEQFKQKVDYLKRKQKLLLENLQNSHVDHENANVSKFSVFKTSSPILFPSNKVDRLSEDEDFLINTYTRDKENETVCKEKACLTNENWTMWNKLNRDDSMESDIDSIETRSLPASLTKVWHPTVPKPFSFTLREEAEKYMTHAEVEVEEVHRDLESNKRSPCRKRRVRPIPLTSKIPLYEKLLAEKEERSRIIREESALNLMSQVRPFRLECDRRAWRCLARSSPEIRSKSVNTSSKFKAKPVPRNLFSTEVYDRMLEDEYYRQLEKKVRAAQLMKSSSLPPSMARRERVKSQLQRSIKNCNENIEHKSPSLLSNDTSVPLGRCKSMMSLLPLQGNNLAAILRCQVSREKLEREIREKMEEKRREQEIKLRESLIGRNPVWRDLRSAARHEHERDLSIRTLLRRNEAREQAERHRLQMEMMLDRVTQIPTLFERHSQDFQSLTKVQQKIGSSKMLQRKKKKKQHRLYMDYENISRSDSGSLSSSSSRSSKLSNASISERSEKSITKSHSSLVKKKGDRSQLKVSINETAELIEDENVNEKIRIDERSISNEGHDENDEHNTER
ncbi:Protein FAM161A [Habropoda laboriosa]|uniref:Protein FAM161A n=1 Tax=Habropoda laboriosa TaxID=597456 RepID=A0A0L7QXE4_9HYME|nr:Protein FAM161A [Habropoda laboriosa]